MIEYRRAMPYQLPALEAAGWQVVGASLYADRQLSVLVVRYREEEEPYDRDVEADVERDDRHVEKR